MRNGMQQLGYPRCHRRDITAHEVHHLEDGREEHSICECEELFVNLVLKGQGRGKGKPFSGQCHYCGRW